MKDKNKNIDKNILKNKISLDNLDYQDYQDYIEKEFVFSIDKISDFDGLRVDKCVSLLMKDISRSHIVSLIQDGYVTVNNEPVTKNCRVSFGDKICVRLPKPRECSVLPEAVDLEIVFEDDDLLVVNKPKNMIVHPANGIYTGTLVNALLHHAKGSLSGINGVMRPGIVHRIDKNTSGLLIVAKNDNAHMSLSEQIKEHSFKREYHAVVYGNLKDRQGTINLPIGRSQHDRKKMAVTYKNSKPAKTIFEKIQNFDGFCHVKLRLETGRTHQIRVHMAHIGHPVAGDDVYGPRKVMRQLGGQCLHAKTIGFIHPTTKKYLEFSSELPDYFKDFLKLLNKK